MPIRASSQLVQCQTSFGLGHMVSLVLHSMLCDKYYDHRNMEKGQQGLYCNNNSGITSTIISSCENIPYCSTSRWSPMAPLHVLREL